MPERLHIEDSQLRELLYLMSHDLRNPLAAIVTNLEFAKRLLARTAVDRDLVESVEDSVTACDVLRRIVSNLDVIVKGQELPVTLQQTDIDATLENVVRRCNDRAAQANLKIAFERNAERTSTMLDRSLFTLTVENLIANSIQHAPRGTVISITTDKKDDHLLITITDGGAAIPDELRETALGPAGHTPTGRRDGTRYGRGLGLLAARAASRACGCTFSVGGDSTNVFSLKVPLLAAS